MIRVRSGDEFLQIPQCVGCLCDVLKPRRHSGHTELFGADVFEKHLISPDYSD